MSIIKKTQKSLMILTLVTSAILSGATTPIYAATSPSTPSQTAIQLAKTETKVLTSSAKPAVGFNVTLNGVKVSLSDPILIDNGTTLLPVRALANLLGIDIAFDNNYKIAIASNEDTILEIPLGITKAVNNQKVVSINNNKTRSILYNSKTYLPVRFVSENLGIKIDYVASTKTVAILTSGSVIVTPTPTPTPTETPATTGTSPQEVFDRAGLLKDVDAKYHKTFDSVAQIQKMLPQKSEKSATFIKDNATYIEVTMDMTQKYDNYIFNNKHVTLSQNDVTLGGIHNDIIVFKDGTTGDFNKIFKSGKTLKDIKYMAFSMDETYIFITPGTVDLTDLQLMS